ncbi:hypothetical protein [Malacoplasma iowae]|uniref:hypothetical protein n=1 Tax=Malacoplasma iowae TaxID=2116 RepID=UPI002A18BB1E|nr:hypothetical protein [Malacoplasma iowae]WPL38828.1 hypothetical protein QX181_04650 [Malacoplasma iowae]WPL40140.1 hypothetical protein QX183_01130 [Malacoplasma iowae]
MEKILNKIIYFECKFGMIMSQIAKSKLNETKHLKKINAHVLSNLNYDELLEYIVKNNTKIIFIISDNLDLKKRLNKIKDVRVIYIKLKDFIEKPHFY